MCFLKISQNLLKNKTNQTLEFVSSTPPTYSSKSNDYITYSLHSPVHMTVTDTLGNVSGYSSSTDNIVDNIPEVYYKIYGDTQTVTIPSTLAHTLDLGGYTDGVYTLDIYKSNSNDQVLSTTTFYSIPTTAHSMARMAYSTTTVATTSTLYLDLNGNKNIDNIITSATTSTYTASSTLPTDDRPLSSITPLPICTTTYTTVTITTPAVKKNGILIPAVKINKQVPIIKCK